MTKVGSGNEGNFRTIASCNDERGLRVEKEGSLQIPKFRAPIVVQAGRGGARIR